MDKIAFVFSGQGSQFAGMGKDLYDEFSVVKHLFDEAVKIKPDLKEICFSSSKEELSITKNTQPAMFVFEMVIAKLLDQNKIKPDCVAGFSMGEVTALTYAGAMDFLSGLEYTMVRADAMEKCASKNPGKMAAILKLDSDDVVNICSKYNDCRAVNFNCPGQTVISGSEISVKAAIDDVEKVKGKAIMLSVSGAFHSPYMEKATVEVADHLETRQLGELRIPVYVNTTGKQIAYSDLKQLMAKQISSPVLWSETIENMIAYGVKTFVEIGPGKVLTGLIKKINADVTTLNIQDVKSFNESVEILKEKSRS